MGAGASSTKDYFPSQLQQQYLAIEEIQDKLLDYDLQLLLNQKGKLLKDQKLILHTLLVKDRQYLSALEQKYSLKQQQNPKLKSFHEDICCGLLGGNLNGVSGIGHSSAGDFLHYLTTSSSHCLNLTLDSCFSKYGVNEMELADHLCSCQSFELAELKLLYPSRHSTTLKDFIQSKAIGGLPFWEFMEFLMIVDRRPDNDLPTSEDGSTRGSTKSRGSSMDQEDHSEEMVLKYVTQLYKAGLGNPKIDQPNNELILSILSVVSRTQCQLISTMFLKQHSLSLAQAIKSSYGGSAERALLIWTSPLMESLTLCFHRLLTTEDDGGGGGSHLLLLSLLSRNERDVLREISSRLQADYQLNLSACLQKRFKGNLLLSLELWCHPSPSSSYDHGLQHTITTLISSTSPHGRDQSLYLISQNPALLEELHTLLAQQMNHLLAYAKKHSVAVPSYDLSQFAFSGEIVTPHLLSEELETEGTQQQQEHPCFESLRECLEDQFILMDTDLNEFLDEMTVWNYLVSLHIGYHDDDLPTLREQTGWVSSEGVICYHDLLSDITRHVLWTMETHEVNIETTVATMWKVFESQAEEQWNSCGYYGQFDQQGEEGKMVEADLETAPDLVAYLQRMLPSGGEQEEGFTKELFWKKIERLIRIPAGELDRVKVWVQLHSSSDRPQDLWETNPSASWQGAISLIDQLFTQIEYDDSNNWVGLLVLHLLPH
jgi:hypothetical protein